MTFYEHIAALREALGGRRFLITVGAGVVNTVLVMFGSITSVDFVEVTKWTVSVFIAGNTIQKVKDVFSSNRKAPLVGDGDSDASTRGERSP